MSEIAKAYVQIIPSAQGITGSLGSILDPEATSAGTSAGGKLSNALGSAIKAGGAIFNAAKTVIGGFASEAVKAGQTFDYSMSNVAAISGATEAELEALRAKAQEMGATSKFSATEAADALGYMAMAGWKADQMLSGIPAVINLAAASGEDLATTSDIVTDALTAFGLKAEDAGNFADILAAASSNANTNVALLGESFKYAAPVVGSMFQNEEDAAEGARDAAVALGLMANAGIKGSNAGTSLRAILTNLAKPTDDMKEAMDVLGVSLEDGRGGMNSLRTVLEQLRSGFGEIKIPMDEFSAAMQQADAEFAAGSLSEKEYTDQTTELMKRAYGAEGALNAEYAAMLAGKMNMSALMAIVNASEEDWNKLTDAIDSASVATDEYSGAAERMKQEMENNLQGDLDSLKSAFEGVQIQVSDRLSPALRDFVQEGTAGLSGMASSLQAGDLPGAIGAVGDTIVNGLDLILSKVPAFLEVGGQLIGTLVQGIMERLPEMASSALDIIASLGQGIMDSLPGLAEGAVGMIESLAQGITDNLPTMIESGMNALMEFSGSLRENAGKLVDAGLGLIDNVAQGLINGLPTFIKTVPTIVSNIAGIINDNFPKILATGIKLIGSLAAGVIQAIPTLIAEFPKIVTAIFNVIMATNWLNLGANIINGIKEGIKNLASTLPTTMGEIATKALAAVRGLDWAHLGSSLISMIGSGISALATNIPAALSAIGTKALSAVMSINWLQLGKDIIAGIVSGLGGAVGALVDAVKAAAKKALDAAKSLLGIGSPSKVFRDQVGKWIPEGMALGIEGGTDTVKDAIGDVAVSAVTGLSAADIPAQSAAAPAVYGGSASGQTTINVYQREGEDSEALARRIASIINTDVTRRREAWA